jgi:hypothetical protein
MRLPVEVAASTRRRASPRVLLGEPAAPGDPEGVEAVVAELAEHPGGEPGEALDGIGQPWHRRATDSGHVEPHHLHRGIQDAGERRERLEGGADAVAYEERRAAAGAGADRDAQPAVAGSHRGDPVRLPPPHAART